MAAPSTVGRKRRRGEVSLHSLEELETVRIEDLRKHAAEQRLRLLKEATALREKKLKELAHIESGGTMLHYDPMSIVFAKGSSLADEDEDEDVSDDEDAPLGLSSSSNSLHLSNSIPKSPAVEAPPPMFLPATPNATPPKAARKLPPPLTNDEIVAKAARDAEVIKRVNELKRAGLIVAKPITRHSEPPRNKTHWDFLLEEMVWLANDFKEEKKWKVALAKKTARTIAKQVQSKQPGKRSDKEEELYKRKQAATLAREIRKYWSIIERKVKEKELAKEEELKRQERDKQLDLLVGQTEQYSRVIAQDFSNESKEAAAAKEKEEKLKVEEEAKKEPAAEDSDPTNSSAMTTAAAVASEVQPKGFTFLTAAVKTKVPFLLKYPLREYQHIGLDWLVSMYEKELNGILADEMGLGKTIMTISLLAHLACEKEIWGPHLIVVPTSVMYNWEREIKKWCPAFKILVYHGTQKERKLKRQGWSKPNSFHVCITSYNLAVQDQQVFKKKKWQYFILDEAHTIKNFKSQRWQVLLNFNSQRRLLLTGTPLQNSLMELWAFMHFLMPHIFQSHSEFKDWFANPMHSMVEGNEVINEDLVSRLHGILRPFLLRRLKKDVEKQLPQKYEHVVTCKLSKRQRYLYEEFIASSETKSTISGGSFFNIVNVLMQLRKVCNHPDLFESRPIVSSLDLEPITYSTSSLASKALKSEVFSQLDPAFFNFVLGNAERLGKVDAAILRDISTAPKVVDLSVLTPSSLMDIASPTPNGANGFNSFQKVRELKEEHWLQEIQAHAKYIQAIRHQEEPTYGADLINLLTLESPTRNIHTIASSSKRYFDYSNSLLDTIHSVQSRSELMKPTIEHFAFAIPKARAPLVEMHCSHPDLSTVEQENQLKSISCGDQSLVLHEAQRRTALYFPDKRLIEYDCGKLQQLTILLRQLKKGGHRALIFTQMSRMLDILEIYLNIHGYTYFRLDGATKVEHRQYLMERFNVDKRIFLFILSTRSGGIGINLTGADTVIFYDSDWNPAMDQQAQDRCHRIGQTREVHIYRLVSEHTIEENILVKANQKRHLDDMVIQGGSFTTEFFRNLDVRDLIDGKSRGDTREVSQLDWEKAVASVEDETDRIAMQRLATEIRQEETEDQLYEENAQNDDPFTEGLLPVERYMFKMLESASLEMTVYGDDYNSLQELQSPPNVEMSIDDDNSDSALFYEVTEFEVGAQKLFINGKRIYGPPDPIKMEEWHVRRGETYEGVLSQVADLLRNPEKEKKRKQMRESTDYMDIDDFKRRKKDDNDKSRRLSKVDDKKRKKDKEGKSKDIENDKIKDKKHKHRRKKNGLLSPEESRGMIWTPEEDNMLLDSVKQFGESWEIAMDIINSSFPRKFRTKKQCQDRWNAIKDNPAITDNPLAPETPATTSQFTILELLKRGSIKKKLLLRVNQIPAVVENGIPPHASHAAVVSSKTAARGPLELLLAIQQRMKEAAENQSQQMPKMQPKMPPGPHNFAIVNKTPYSQSKVMQHGSNIILNSGGGHSQNLKRINEAIVRPPHPDSPYPSNVKNGPPMRPPFMAHHASGLVPPSHAHGAHGHPHGGLPSAGVHPIVPPSHGHPPPHSHPHSHPTPAASPTPIPPSPSAKSKATPPKRTKAKGAAASPSSASNSPTTPTASSAKSKAKKSRQ